MACNILKASLKNYLTNNPNLMKTHTAEHFKKANISWWLHLIAELSPVINIKKKKTIHSKLGSPY